MFEHIITTNEGYVVRKYALSEFCWRYLNDIEHFWYAYKPHASVYETAEQAEDAYRAHLEWSLEFEKAEKAESAAKVKVKTRFVKWL